ncbi:hypothetical protein F0562_004813 [Nyssa sinensis]|uniref:FIGL1 N-terminal domain-containing protein n=1 Tax=Nyssa sinensis TaxID=561372 RepID=A0A5J5AIP9_9ASTE|nr:hypothetical protein F0562_004813 [Nyssa sinensis]
MEEESEVCWRKEIDTNLKRLHSLLFGADIALQKRDFNSAQILALRLIGFLDSHSHTDIDEAFIRPIRREALSKLDAARRQAFEQAGRDPGCVFGKRGDIDIDKIKQSKYFQALLHQSKGRTLNELGDQLDRQDKSDCKASKVLIQAKLSSLYGNNISRANVNSCKSYLNYRSNSSEDCVILEKAHSVSEPTQVSQCLYIFES